MLTTSHRPREGCKRRTSRAPRSHRRAGGSALLPLLLLPLFLAPAGRAASGTTASFLAEVFDGEVPAPSVLWLSVEDREIAAEILGHEVRRLRQRYWNRDGRSVFVLDEIGKEKPITVGVVLQDLAVDRVRVLEYREDRGGEVRYPFFTDQFRGARLDEELRLSQRVDGISGATLSVRALKGVTRLALYLQGEILEEAGRD